MADDFNKPMIDLDDLERHWKSYLEHLFKNIMSAI